MAVSQLTYLAGVQVRASVLKPWLMHKTLISPPLPPFLPTPSSHPPYTLSLLLVDRNMAKTFTDRSVTRKTEEENRDWGRDGWDGVKGG